MIDLGMFEGHCFYIKNMNVLCRKWERLAYKQILIPAFYLKRQCKAIGNGKKFKCISKSSEKVLHGSKPCISYSTCQFVEYMSVKTGKHIYCKLCGHVGERVVWHGKGDEICQDKGYEPATKTIFQHHGCKWHACICLKNSTKADENRYFGTTEKLLGTTFWECEKPPKIEKLFDVKFRSFLHYIVFDFKSMLEASNQRKTSELAYKSK